MLTRVLVVDDSRPFLEAARDTLERESVAVVGLASSAADALAEAARLRPDVLLVDVHLGPESGVYLVRLVAQEPALAAVTLILMSSYREEDLGGLVTVTPAAGFVTKLDLSAREIERIRCGAAGRGATPGEP